MKRFIVLAAVMALAATTLAPAAGAAKKPVKTTFYFHGTEQVGEVEMISGIGTYPRMDTTAPTGDQPKERGFAVWKGTPWNDCAGFAFTPVWTGTVSGRIVGDMKLTLHGVFPPTAVNVQVWPDVASQQCASNDTSTGNYPEPVAVTNATLTPGPGVTEITLKDVNFKAQALLMIQILPDGPNPGRILFDSADYASMLEFTCVPTTGKKCA
jgi:hypothetical protein